MALLYDLFISTSDAAAVFTLAAYSLVTTAALLRLFISLAELARLLRPFPRLSRRFWSTLAVFSISSILRRGDSPAPWRLLIRVGCAGPSKSSASSGY